MKSYQSEVSLKIKSLMAWYKLDEDLNAVKWGERGENSHLATWLSKKSISRLN